MIIKRASSASFLFCVIAFLSSTFLTLSHAAPTTTKYSLTDFQNVIADWSSDSAILFNTNRRFAKLLLNFEIIRSSLSKKCDGLEDHLTEAETLLKGIQPADRIPNLQAVIKPVQKVGERLKIFVLKKPRQTVCKKVNNIRSRIDDLAIKFKKVQDKNIVKAVKFFDLAHRKVDEVLAGYENVSGNPSNFAPFDRLCDAVQDVRDLQCELIVQMQELIKQANPLYTYLNIAQTGVLKVTSFVEKVFAGPARKVLNEVSNLLSTTITLPIPRGAKERGVGIIPTCCPSGYSNSGGLCYKNCRSGYQAVLFTCVEKCRRGWKDIGVTCTRTVKKKVGFIRTPIVQFDAKKSYGRLGKISATFGNKACSCRRDKRYLEAGLCYNKCGRDHLKSYGTSFLTKCLDLRFTKLTILDLAENLNIFKHAEKSPAIGNLRKQVNGLIARVFGAISEPISEALKINAPIPGLAALDRLTQLFDFEIFDLDGLTDALLRATSCKDRSAQRQALGIA